METGLEERADSDKSTICEKGTCPVRLWLQASTANRGYVGLWDRAKEQPEGVGPGSLTVNSSGPALALLV